MNRRLWPLAMAFCLTVAGAAQAQTLRWASAGDAQTMDPDSQNETLTNMMNGQVYERLVMRDKGLNIVPQLALSWQQTSPTSWRFKLRPGVKFHDGSPFSADDVVFSVERARQPSSQIAGYASALGEVKKVDATTVDFIQKDPNPIFLHHLDLVYIMSKAWCEKNNVAQAAGASRTSRTRFAALNANGTGPYVHAQDAPARHQVRTVHVINPNYWRKIEGNVHRGGVHARSRATRRAPGWPC